MPTTHTTVTSTRTTGVAVHTISFRGLSGAIFIILALATVLYTLGFTTVAWLVRGSRNDGLWQTCSCGQQRSNEDWFKAVQAMITIGFIGLLLAFLLACIYMCVHAVSKNSTILAMVCVCFISVVFMAIGFCIIGVKSGEDLSWSFGVTVVAGILTLIAGILSIMQMRNAGVRI